MKKVLLSIFIIFLLTACGGGSEVSTPTPTQEIELEAWIEGDDPPIYLQYIDDLVIHFNLPMDPNSSDTPISFTPNIEGEFTWADNNTTLVFSPIDYFPDDGEQYHLSISDNLLSQLGQGFPQGKTFSVDIARAESLFSASSYGEDLLGYENTTALVEFRSSMDHESVEAHMTIEPNVAYKLEWISESKMEITLQVEPEPGLEYQLQFAPGVLLLNGDAGRAEDFPISFEKLDVKFSRENEEDRLSPFEFRFTYPVDPSLAESLISVTPDRDFHTDWQDEDRVLLLYPEEPLGLGESFAIEIPIEPLTGSGAKLTSEKDFFYLSPSVIGNVKMSNDEGKAITVIRFVVEPQIESVLDTISFQPEIDYTANWDADLLTLTLISTDILPASTEYAFSLVGVILDKNGDELPVSVIKTLATKDLVEISEDWNRDDDIYYFTDNYPEDPVKIKFSRAMNKESVEEGLEISPAINFSFNWVDDQTLEIVPETYFQEGIRYYFTIPNTVLDAQSNLALSKYVEWYVYMGAMEDAINFGFYGADIEVVDLHGNRIVDVGLSGYYQTTQKFESIQVEMVRVTESQFIDFIKFANERNFVYGRSGAIYDTSSIAVQARWEVTKEELDAVYESDNARGIVLPDTLPEGLYVMNLITDHVNDQLAVVASTGSVVAKLGESPSGAGQITVWVNEINSYMMQDAEVRLYALNGDLLASGTTDEIGVFQSTYNTGQTPYLVVATRGNMYAVTGIGGEWEYTAQWREDYWEDFYGVESPEEYFVYTYTDRPIYHPGQTIYYKSILRYDWDANFELPDAGETVVVEFRDAKGNLLESQQVVLNRYGSVNGNFELAEGAMLGNYSVGVKFNGETHNQGVKVQEYVKPDYSVMVIADKEIVVQGDEISITVDTQYLFGEPVANTEIAVNIYELASAINSFWYYYDNDLNEDDLDIEGYSWYETDFHEKTFITDDNGLATFTITLPVGKYRNAALPIFEYYNQPEGLYYYSLFGVEVTVEDESGQSVSGLARIKSYSTSAKLEFNDNWLVDAGKETAINIKMSSDHAVPIDGENIQLIISKLEKHQGFNELDSQDLVTDENGHIEISLTLEKGYYRLDAVGEDESHRKFSASQYLYAYDGDTSFWNDYQLDLSLDSDKASYTPGETAEIRVQTNYSGEGLLTIERGGVLEYQTVRVEAPFSNFTVPIYPDYAPNVFVTLQLWQPTDDELDNNYSWYSIIPDSQLYSSSIELLIEDYAHELNVEITSDKEVYAPGETANFYVTVTNYKGEPVDAEISAALVDEAIFLLSDDLSNPIHGAFFFDRDHSISDFNSMMARRWFIDPTARGGGGPGGNTPGEGANPRADFPDTLIWIPRIVVDEDGKARVTVTMPDSLTTWRFTAKAVTPDTEVGENSHTVVTQKEVVIRPLLPQNLLEGDSFILSSLVHNYTEETLSFEVNVQADLLELSDNSAQTIEIRAGESKLVGWQATAPSTGDAIVTIYVSSGEYEDVISMPIEVNPNNYAYFESTSGQFEQQVTLPVTIPENYLPGSMLHLSIDRTITSALLDGSEYLTGFPWGCVEQTMSAALPNAVVARAFSDLGQEERIGAVGLNEKIRKSVQRLYGFQHSDGGWGWWYDDTSGVYLTSWVLYGLAITAQSGYDIEPQVIESAANYLEYHLDETDDFTKAYALYALSIVNHGNREAALELTGKFSDLDLFSQSALILTLWQVDEKETAQQLLEIILANIEDQPGGFAYISGLKEDGYYHKIMMSSEIRSNALLLKAIMTVEPEHWSRDGLASWLMSKRERYGWGTTNETSFAMIALTDYLRYEQTSDQEYELEIIMNGDTPIQLSLRAGQPFVETLLPYYENLTPGENQIQINSDGSDMLYFSITSETISNNPLESTNGISITRTYLNPETKEAVTTIQEGDLILVQLEIRLQEDGYYLLIEDQLPGGFSALNEGLAITSHEEFLSEYPPEPIYRWKKLDYNNKEIHSNRVVFFITEWKKGSHTITYYARANVAGTFTALPAQISAMYEKDFFGYSTTSIVEILE